MKVADQAAQLFHGTGVRQGPATDVIVEIELVFVGPHRVVDAERRHLHSPPIGGEQVKPRHGMVTEALKDGVPRGASWCEYRDAPDIHRGLGSFQIKEPCIQRRKPVHCDPRVARMFFSPLEARPSPAGASRAGRWSAA